MKKWIAGILLLTMLMTVPSALAANTEVSGKVVIYTSMYQFVIDMMAEAVKKEFPNL